MTLHVLVNAAEHDVTNVFEDEASSPASLMVPGAHDAHAVHVCDRTRRPNRSSYRQDTPCTRGSARAGSHHT